MSFADAMRPPIHTMTVYGRDTGKLAFTGNVQPVPTLHDGQTYTVNHRIFEPLTNDVSSYTYPMVSFNARGFSNCDSLTLIQFEGAISRLKQIMERQRSAAAHWIAAIRAEMSSWEWLAEGRGSYEWDDERYREEFGACMRSLELKLTSATGATGALDLTDSEKMPPCNRFVDGDPHGKRCTLPAGHDRHA